MNGDAIAELDLAIPDMDTQGAEERVAALLRELPGVVEVRLVERGAFIRYRPSAVSHDEICTEIRRAGYRASTFQDSESGETGTSSQ